MKQEMYEGEISASPYEMGDATGCDYCPYRDICGFDLKIEGCAYRHLEKYSVEEAVAMMSLEVEADGKKSSGEGDGDSWA